MKIIRKLLQFLKSNILYFLALADPLANMRLRSRSSRVSRCLSDRPEVQGKPDGSQGVLDARQVKSFH